MVGALWTGISGLAGSQTGLDNESNNIANVNTIGYKSSRISFADQMYQDKIGKGVTSFDVEKLFTQGSLKITGVSFDMALDRDGFFQVSDGSDMYYTRAGNFRMGESGTLEDVAGNTVQGWAMQPISDKDITTTDNNSKIFTDDYTKLLGHKVIRDTTTIESIVARATDYTQSAQTDSNAVFTGAGYKLAGTKKADVEALIDEYNKALTVYSEADPKPTPSSSKTQQTLLDYDLDNATTILETNDEIFMIIDGSRYSQSFDTDEATTMKKFVDQLSNVAGFTARMVNTTNTEPYEVDTSSGTGQIIIESLIPGKTFRVTEAGWTRDNVKTKAAVTNTRQSVLGTGMGHINSVKDALSEAIAGKQQDVYPPSDLVFSPTATLNDLTYQIDIYDKDTDSFLTVPATPLVINDAADVDAVVAAINTIAGSAPVPTELAYHVKAYNINGNLVVKTLDRNNDVEFTGRLTSTTEQEEQTIVISGTATGTGVEFLGVPVPGVVVGDTHLQIAAKIIAAKDAIIAGWNSDAANNIAVVGAIRQIEDITLAGDILTIKYVRGTPGDNSNPIATLDVDDPAAVAALGNDGIALAAATETVQGGSVYTVVRNPTLSGREGAAAEFLQITTTINQTATKGDLQLRLDTLRLTDSAFGDFEVDKTGLITMTQNGARFAIGQVAVGRFTDNRGLDPIGDNLLRETTRSGPPIFNINNSKMAEIEGGTLELSNSNLSESLVNLMVFQRAFEANAKSITTADQILTTLIQLKR